jgi:hypothetical protein
MSHGNGYSHTFNLAAMRPAYRRILQMLVGHAHGTNAAR